MSITKLTTNGLAGAKYDTVSADNYYMEPIATTLLASSASSIVFSNIPQGYKHLQLRCFSKSTNASFQQIAFNLQLNGDTGSNYAAHQLYGDGSSAGASAPGISATSMLLGQEPSAVNNPGSLSMGATVIDILDYANVYKFKTLRSLTGSDINGAGTVALRSGLWMNTAAVTTISLTETSTFAANSRFSLYGIRG